MERCVVCGIHRFMVEGKDYNMFPYVCSSECGKETPHLQDCTPWQGPHLWIEHMPVDGGTFPCWSAGYESPIGRRNDDQD